MVLSKKYSQKKEEEKIKEEKKTIAPAKKISKEEALKPLRDQGQLLT